jgi:flagellar hook protein FlgE
MLKSLYSGVSGLQSHQIAMDVESNNIANVNTVGFKYSRANFSDLLAQTKSIATAPQGELGGKNPVQVGLGSTIDSMTRIFSQGSVQSSDKNTDVAIQGDGFFIISPDGGNTYKYTRSGDFKFDAGGNFVDNNGFIVQGWLRDPVTGFVDATAPIKNIQIPPGLTTPAQPTSEVVIKANLNSGPLVDAKSPAYKVSSGPAPALPTPPALDANGNPIEADDMGVMFNDSGEAFSLQAGQGIWAGFQTAETTGGTIEDSVVLTFDRAPVAGDTISVEINGVVYSAPFNVDAATTYADLALAVGAVSTLTAVGDTLTFEPLAAGATMVVADLQNDNGSASGVVAVSGTAHELSLTFTLDDGTTKQVTTSGGTGYETPLQNAARYVSAINAQSSVTGVSASYDMLNNNITLTNSNLDANASHNIRLTAGNANSGFNTMANTTVTTAYRYQYDPTSAATSAGYDKTFTTIADLREALENEARGINPTAHILTSTATASVLGVDETHDFSIAGVTVNIGNIPDATTAAGVATAYANAINTAVGLPAGVTATTNGATLIITNASGANITLDTTVLGGFGAGISGLPANVATTIPYLGASNNNIEVSVNAQGKFEIRNPGGAAGDYDISLAITGMDADSVVGTRITENERFTRNMEALNSTLPVGSTGAAYSQSFNAATHSASIDVFDSLGSKHTLRTEYRKIAVNESTGSEWSMKVSVPEPATINSVEPYNEKMGFIRFNNDGSLATYNPPNVSFSANNGSAPNQQVSLELGTANKFDGMTSFDKKSSTSGISQDGFTGGDLVGIRIDQSGTLVGSFSNGRSFGLAQIGMAKFTNNEGLSTEGGNVYTQTANSGDPIIGTAATAGRGFMQSASLEASNVDLSKSLTQLIIIQRGYQANGKTITTSDTLLETLLGIKR